MTSCDLMGRVIFWQSAACTAELILNESLQPLIDPRLSIKGGDQRTDRAGLFPHRGQVDSRSCINDHGLDPELLNIRYLCSKCP